MGLSCTAKSYRSTCCLFRTRLTWAPSYDASHGLTLHQYADECRMLAVPHWHWLRFVRSLSTCCSVTPPYSSCSDSLGIAARTHIVLTYLLSYFSQHSGPQRAISSADPLSLTQCVVDITEWQNSSQLRLKPTNMAGFAAANRQGHRPLQRLFVVIGNKQSTRSCTISSNRAIAYLSKYRIRQRVVSR